MSNLLDEASYYDRHLRLPGFDAKVQLKLKSARVLVIGIGGLGCPVSLYLAGAGIGTIGLCDADIVSGTNLHRQILFDIDCLGEKKVDVAERKLQAMNPHISFEKYDRFVDSTVLAELVKGFDVVVDCTDNFDSKYAISDACEMSETPLVYGGIFQFEGHVSVFHLKTEPNPEGFSYRDLCPEKPPASMSMNCVEGGVIGVLPGVIGTLQANEVIKVLTELGEPLVGTLLKFDALTSEFKHLRLGHHRVNRHRIQLSNHSLSEITYDALMLMRQDIESPILIDVRTLTERSSASLGGIHIELASLPQRLHEIPQCKTIVVYCKSGARSGRAVLYLTSIFPEVRIFSLKNGIDGTLCEL